jgi:hypothetical protein
MFGAVAGPYANASGLGFEMPPPATGVGIELRGTPSRAGPRAVQPFNRKATPQLLRRAAVILDQNEPAPKLHASIAGHEDVQAVIDNGGPNMWRWPGYPLPFGRKARLQPRPIRDGDMNFWAAFLNQRPSGHIEGWPNVYIEGDQQADSHVGRYSVRLDAYPVDLVAERRLTLRATTLWRQGVLRRSRALFILHWNASGAPPRLKNEADLLRQIGALTEEEQGSILARVGQERTDQGIRYLSGQGKPRRNRPTIALDLAGGTTNVMVALTPFSSRTLQVLGGSLLLNFGELTVGDSE